ncbi:ABC transporter substrate-binding protein [Xanthobacter agilis]|uniref:ABC transporter substrate binding protein (PQQ-dependent alcohol dehydrogenase system) n=1 Tax=Xanthobacter agilis TaxID=47492 RepID=A0ABU0LER5_XANAG|nr:ABC transporter substrate-binding protein [Xanthobacter agilis]MDQ0505626.1 ABC transporter substrate binding protein (PQQ-dependent alcohol dehydrogenase system) [Xanthobacter agilis]
MPLRAQPASPEAAAPTVLEIPIGLLTREVPPPPLYDLLAVPEDDAVAGAALAIKDNNSTGAFTGQHFTLNTATLAEGDDPVAAAKALVDGGNHFLIVNLPADQLIAVADAVKPLGGVVFNVGALDDTLRADQCRANVFHIAPSRAMLADALAQFLAVKRWTKLFLVVGPQPDDIAYGEAVKRAARKFGLKIVAEKPWTFGPLARERSDSITRSDALVFTRGVDADVLVVADEANDFGTFIPFRTAEPRLVVGTQGLTASTWHQAQDAWGSAQLQSRFLRGANRTMRPTDYQAWLAARMVGEAATRAKDASPAAIADYLRSPDFSIAAFKGVPLSVRPWDQQVRQPLLIAQPFAIVAVAPEDGFLHQHTPLDTLGFDQPESKCRLK